jgi:hypothetical protein
VTSQVSIKPDAKRSLAAIFACTPSVFGHVVWVFVAHVDHGRADLDCTSACTNGGKQRERRTELAREVMNAKECSVGAQVFGGNSKIDVLVRTGLSENVALWVSHFRAPSPRNPASVGP